LNWRRWQGWNGWLLGALYGIGAPNPAVLAFAILRVHGWRRRYLRGAFLTGVVGFADVFLVLSPWLHLRYYAFGHFVFIRDDFDCSCAWATARS
jgi:hypothetical protein